MIGLIYVDNNYYINNIYNNIYRYGTLINEYDTLRSKINLLINSFNELKSDLSNINSLLEEGIIISGKPLGNGIFKQNNANIDKYLSRLAGARGYCSRRITEINGYIAQAYAEIAALKVSNKDVSN